MGNIFLFINSAKSDDNRMLVYDNSPTIAGVKDDIINDLFNGIFKEPNLTYTVNDSKKNYTVTITTDRELKSAVNYFNKINEIIKIIVQEAHSSHAAPQFTAAASRTPSPDQPTQQFLNAPLTVQTKAFPAPLYNIPILVGIPTPVGAPRLNQNAPVEPEMNARFVSHVNFGSTDSTIEPGVYFSKKWKVRNDGDLAWPRKIVALHLSGHQLGAAKEQEIIFNKIVNKGDEAEITVAMTAPQLEGFYRGFWRLADSHGKKFGQRLEAQIQVSKKTSEVDAVKMPTQKELLNNDLDIETKKSYLALLFPEMCINGFGDLLDYFYEDSTLERGNIDQILNGSIKNNEGNPLTMKEIISKVYWTQSCETKEYPWQETSE